MGKACSVSMLILVACSFFCVAFASDPKPLQDFCVADFTSSVRVNGLACKDASLVTADDFFYPGGVPRVTDTHHLPQFGFNITQINVFALPGLNTQGLSINHLQFEPLGVNPPHIHPRAAEIVVVLEGSLLVGFVTSSPENKFVGKVLGKGDVFVVPLGLVHFQHNIGSSHATILNIFNSQNPGVTVLGESVFGSNPPISSDILAKAFLVNKAIVDQIQSKLE